jgi:hypothetical protein
MQSQIPNGPFHIQGVKYWFFHLFPGLQGWENKSVPHPSEVYSIIPSLHGPIKLFLQHVMFTSTDQSLKKDLIVERIFTTSVGFTYIGLKEIKPFGSLSNSNKD